MGPSHPNQDGACSAKIEKRRQVIEDACLRDSHDNSLVAKIVEVRASPYIHRTLGDKARQDVLRSSTVRYRLTSPDLVADLSKFTAHSPASKDLLSAAKKSATVPH